MASHCNKHELGLMEEESDKEEEQRDNPSPLPMLDDKRLTNCTSHARACEKRDATTNDAITTSTKKEP